MSEPLDKVDRALEIAVIDWLQYEEFPVSYHNKPVLTLQLIEKRRLYCTALEKEIVRVAKEKAILQARLDRMEEILAEVDVDGWDYNPLTGVKTK